MTESSSPATNGAESLDSPFNGCCYKERCIRNERELATMSEAAANARHDACDMASELAAARAAVTPLGKVSLPDAPGEAPQPEVMAQLKSELGAAYLALNEACGYFTINRNATVGERLSQSSIHADAIERAKRHSGPSSP